MGVVLKRENNIFFGRKEGNPKLLRESQMVIFWRDNILWRRKNKSLRFKLDDGEKFSLGN